MSIYTIWYIYIFHISLLVFISMKAFLIANVCFHLTIWNDILSLTHNISMKIFVIIYGTAQKWNHLELEDDCYH